MKLILTRNIFKDDFTLGIITHEGKHICYTVEDAVRPVKIPRMTAIPAGEYEIIISPSARFKKLLPELLNVPNFKGIRIHSGNNEHDTEGCILVGLVGTENGVEHSRDAMKVVQPMIQAALDNGEKVTIQIVEER